MSEPAAPARADQAFRDKGGDRWAALQERTDAQLDPLGRAAMAKLGLTPGARVLDVGCGCGQTALELADIVGPRGRVVGIDVSEPMLARAHERVAGRAEIELVCADAQTHPFPAGAFEALYSRFGTMFFEDARAAFRNLGGALVPRGRMAFACWRELGANPWGELPLRAVMDVLGTNEIPPFLRAENPGPYYLSDAAKVRAILTDAGFADVALERLDLPLHFGGAMTLAEAVAYAQQIGPAARAIAEADPALRPALEAALTGALAPFAGPRGVWMDASVFVVTARVP